MIRVFLRLSTSRASQRRFHYFPYLCPFLLRQPLGTPRHLAGDMQDFFGQSCQAGDRGARRRRARARQQLVRKVNVLAGYGRAKVRLCDAPVRPEGRAQRVVMRCKEGAAAKVGKCGQRGGGDGGPVDGRRAAAQFVDRHQAGGRRLRQNLCRLPHLHHERRQAGRQVIARSDPGKKGVGRSVPEVGGGHAAADLGEQHENERGAAHS
mmetsp:Transcript_15613/g.48870  ORF Transcript_15613/g.48870 Transcript_15613/m.48870 type:complete len:208 (+) Transcript_15613:40-663(+)